MWVGHMKYREILDDLGKIGGRQFEENNAIHQCRVEINEKGVLKMRAQKLLWDYDAQNNGGTFKCN